MASMRAVIPGQFFDETVFAPIAPGFSRYGDRFEFVVDSATQVDVDQRKATLESGQVLSYDHLVITRGAKTMSDMPISRNILKA